MFVPLGEKTEYYIPAGIWTSFFHPERTLKGPLWVREHVPIDEIPVWVRPGSVLVLGPETTGRPDYDYTKGLEVRAYQLEEDGPAVIVNIPSGKGVAIAGKISVKRVKGSADVSVEAEDGLQVQTVLSL